MVIIYIFSEVFAHNNEVHGEGVLVIMFCNNLSARLDTEVKTIFGINKIFLCYIPLNMENFIHVIDAGLQRSVKLAVGGFLDEWLVDSDDMKVWEGGMTAGEKRILIKVFD